ncbi:MAG: AI-2E family transporter [Betaproteobacteria bacterium]|nr:AI-2E family transporter [Betaproteobacteria bacterium]
MTEALAPFAAAFLLAYMLEPIANRLSAWGSPRALSSILAILVGLALVVGLVAIGVPVVNHEIRKLQERLPELIATVYAQVYPWLAQTGLPIDDTDALKQKLLDWLSSRSSDLSSTVWGALQSGLGALLALLGWLVLVPVALFFLLKDWAQILSKTLWLVPERHRENVREASKEVHITLQGYLQGQLRVMLALSVYYSLGLLIAGFSGWLSIGLISGLLVFIPYAGFALGVLLALVSGLLELGWMQTLIAVGIIYGLGQLLESFVLTPKLVGDRVGLHPLAVIFALVFFGALFGFFGILIAVPLAAVIVVLFRRLIDSRR